MLITEVKSVSVFSCQCGHIVGFVGGPNVAIAISCINKLAEHGKIYIY